MLNHSDVQEKIQIKREGKFRWDFDDNRLKKTKCIEVRNWKVSKQIAIQKISDKYEKTSNNKELGRKIAVGIKETKLHVNQENIAM